MSLTHITKCLLCPAEKTVRIVADQIPQMKPGEAPPEAVGKYVQALTAHLQKKHPEDFHRALTISQTLMAFLILANFETTDPGVGTGRDLTRAFIHKLTRINDVTESDLMMRYEKIDANFGTTERAEILAQFRDLRDFLLEEGEYQPRAPFIASVGAEDVNGPERA